MDEGSPLKTNPLEPSTALTPSWAAAARKLLGSRLEISNSERANPSGKEFSSVGYSIFAERRVEMWQLNKSTAPSSVPSDVICRPISLGSPSLDSPSVRCKTVGGNPRGCSNNQRSMISFALPRASHIGVFPSDDGWIQTGYRTGISTQPPAPSETRL